MRKLEELEREYKRALEDRLVADKVQEAISNRLRATGNEIAEIWMDRECVKVGTVLVNTKSIDRAHWVVVGFEISHVYTVNGKIPMPTLNDVKLNCRRFLKGNRQGKRKRSFYAWQLKDLEIINEKGGDKNGETERRQDKVS